MKLAFLGLGVMGFPMAGHLAKAGHEVTVYNRTAAKARAWTEQHKGAARTTPAEAAAGAEIVFTCVGNDDDVRQIVLGAEGALAGMSKGALLVDHTTASAELARELGRQVMTMSASRAASAGVAARRASGVTAVKRSATARVRFQTVSVKPGRARWRAMGAPMAPRPRKATCIEGVGRGNGECRRPLIAKRRAGLRRPAACVHLSFG